MKVRKPRKKLINPGVSCELDNDWIRINFGRYYVLLSEDHCESLISFLVPAVKYLNKKYPNQTHPKKRMSR